MPVKMAVKNKVGKARRNCLRAEGFLLAGENPFPFHRSSRGQYPRRGRGLDHELSDEELKDLFRLRKEAVGE